MDQLLYVYLWRCREGGSRKARKQKWKDEDEAGTFYVERRGGLCKEAVVGRTAEKQELLGVQSEE